jgi:hypothetical protein
MSPPLVRTLRTLPVGLGVLTLVSLVPLLVWDVTPHLFPARAHDVLAAVPLASIAVAYLVHQGRRGAASMELARAALLALAFLFWAANQLWPDHPLATLFNDIAVAGFVLDVFLVIVQRPTTSAPAILGESEREGSAPSTTKGLAPVVED